MRFLAVFTALVGGAYAYLAARLAPGPWSRLALAIPLALIWLVPVLYWVGERKRNTRADELLHVASYVCMGWLSFALVFSVLRDLLIVVTGPFDATAAACIYLTASGAPLVLAGSVLALGAGMLAAFRGPRLREVDLPIEGLPPALEGFRIVQISDLHIGATIRVPYVRRVVRMANALHADLVALTGDFVDGPVARLAPHVAPLAHLGPAGRVFFILGNHEVYSGARPWIEHFRSFGFKVLLNQSEIIEKNGSRLLVGGVLDPAGGEPRPDLAIAPADFRLLLAHNPKLAPLGAKAGFDLQLSGHTHAGQFFPWTLAVKLVHSPHVCGLSREGRMRVYVSAGTGTWGPPVRFGSSPELTLIRLTRNSGTEQ